MNGDWLDFSQSDESLNQQPIKPVKPQKKLFGKPKLKEEPKQNNTGYQDEIASLEIEIQHLKTDNNKLKYSSEQLKHRIGVLNGMIKDAENQNKSKHAKIIKQEQELFELMNKISMLEQENEALKQRIKELENKPKDIFDYSDIGNEF